MPKKQKIKKEVKMNNGFFEHGDHIHVLDIGCAAALIALNSCFGTEKECDRKCGQKCVIFKQDKKTLKIIADYFSDKLLINAQDMALCLQIVISENQSN